jgi:endonuclease/exonuclease/phosphatase family metal-dependent hydrolase
MAENDNMLRIITYNIHCWHSAFWESNCRQVQAYLGRLKPHVVGFQEVPFKYPSVDAHVAN